MVEVRYSENKNPLNFYIDDELKSKIVYGAEHNKLTQAAFVRMTLAEALRDMKLPEGMAV